MAWSAPQTWTTGQTVTAADLNADIRDNMLETAAAKATTAGGLFVATGANTLAERVFGSAIGDPNYVGVGSGDDIYTSYNQARWSSGTNVTVTVTTGTQALIFHGFGSASMSSGAFSVYQSYTVGGATPAIAASDTWRCAATPPSASAISGTMRMHYRSDLTAGSNTFTLQAASADVSVSSVQRPFLFVLPL